jgi:MFS transporter, FHS family, glucose/mannose:H+ symporter
MKFLLIVAYLSMFVLGLADNIRGPLFPEIIRAFDLSGMRSSYFYASTSFAAFCASVASYSILRKKSLFFLLNSSLLMMAIGMSLIGMAVVFPILILGSIILGLSLGGLAVSQNLLVSENISLESHSKALSGLHSIYGVASLLAPLLAAQATLAFSSWRSAFFVVSLVCMILFVSFLLFASRKSIAPLKSTDLNRVEPSIKSKAPFWGKVTISGLFAFYVVAEILIATRLALYMRDYFAMNLEQSSLYVTYFFIFLFSGRLLFAFARIPGSVKLQMNMSLGISLVLLLLGLYQHPFFLTLVGLAMAPYYPLSITYISQKTGANERQYLTIALSFQSLAVVGMHLGAGYLTDSAGGVKQAFTIGIAALFISLVCLNGHPKKL